MFVSIDLYEHDHGMLVYIRYSLQKKNIIWIVCKPLPYDTKPKLLMIYEEDRLTNY